MKHHGNVTKINGAEVEPVDIITFGSPCQDLSVAGKRAGIQDGERSNLFFEAVRIIKEMREATNGEYPKYAVWENVPGAFSSNKGNDFHAVLEALCSVCDSTVSIPRPCDAKRTKLVWNKAGEIVGDNYSVAWRTLDAQYWGVPQRRKRIYLVADFGSQRAGEILFKPDGLPRNHAESRKAGEGSSADVVGSVDGSVGVECVKKSAGFKELNGAKAYGNAYEEEKAPTLAAGKIDASVVIALQANGIDRADTAGCNGCGWRENESYTLNTVDRHAVCYDARGNGDGETACTITGDHESRITDYTAVAVQEPKPPRRYIIRRLTPTECARLQGFPDWWSTLAPYNPADAEFWEDVRKTHAEINGKKYKPTKNLKKWYEGLHTDSAEYKMWGNGIALPNARYVIQGIAEQGAKTLGSLFDGSGGFPLAGVLNGITPLWASEVEPYPIAVTKSRFKEVHNA
jgi:DNA (cytosine-5)-methyltransferase 1